ncbi:MAG: Fic family protein [Flavobacteriales bacterium]|nr:MAG: Fic family protein [Flavobacteriales bacterium]
MSQNDLLSAIDDLKRELEGLLPMRAEQERRLWEKLNLEWNYNSNHIEGNTLTYGETFLLLVHGRVTGEHSAREIDEMRAHNVAIGIVREWASDPSRNIAEADVRDLNRVLLKEPFWKEAITADRQRTRIQVIPGQYKTEGNLVLQPDGTVFHYAAPAEVAPLMRELMAWYGGTDNVHPLIVAALLHHRFIVIHPFGDGNGRTARLLVNYHLMRNGFMPLIVKSVDKNAYLSALQKADAGDLAPLIQFLALQEQWSLELALKAALGEDLEERKDWVKEAEVLYKRTAQNGADIAQRKEEERVLFAKVVQRDGAHIVSAFRGTVRVFERFYTTANITLQLIRHNVPGHNTLLLPLDENGLLNMFRDVGMEPYVLLYSNLHEDALGTGAKPICAQLNWFAQNGDQVVVLSCGSYSKRFQADMGHSLLPELNLALDEFGKAMLKEVAG